MKTQKSVTPKVPLGPVLQRYFCETRSTSET